MSMRFLETNIFPITNLSALSTRYRLARISGLRPDQAEYYQNRHALQRKLGYKLRKPVLVIERNGVPFLVVPEEVTAIPAQVSLVRVAVGLSLDRESFEIDYSNRSPETDAIALRFLRFLLQTPLYHDPRLWQPGAGRPFYPRVPDRKERGIAQYVGFSARPVVCHDGGIGLCVDPTSCYVSQQSLPAGLARDEFNRSWKGSNCIYRFGQDWYEIRLHALADRSVSEYSFVVDGRTWTLMDYLLEKASRPLSSDLANLPEDASVLLYMNSRNHEMAAAGPLCYPVFSTSDQRVASQHRNTILQPRDRRALTSRLVDTYLRNLNFGGTKLRLSDQPLRAPRTLIAVPDLRFGNDAILSVRRSQGVTRVDLRDLGTLRLDMLKNSTAGFYTSAPLDRQYLLLPRSVSDTFGTQFLKDLAVAVDELFPQEGGYRPTIIQYEDRGRRTFVRQARAIRDAMTDQCSLPGYALVMVHYPVDRPQRSEDQLAAMVVREMRERCDVRAAVIHSKTAQRSYREVRGPDGRLSYCCAPNQVGRLKGYLRNVALSKILLTNQRWPFVPATPLHTEVTIGIDVKHNTCGLLVFGNSGDKVRSHLRKSRQKERLLESQMANYLVDVVRKEAESRGSSVASLVIHRDGRVWDSELQGIHRAIDALKVDGHITADATYAVVEISKTSPAPLRLYWVQGKNGHHTMNPRLGTVHYISCKEAFVCTTGDPLLRQGTAHPLHVTLVDGTLPFDKCVEDLFALSVLSWTYPEGCMRYPITIKLNDRILASEAGEYDLDAIDFGADHVGNRLANGGAA